MISRSVLLTLTYSDHFGFPLTLEELKTRLVGPFSNTLLTSTLSKMLRKGEIIKTANYYHLPEKELLVSRRESRKTISLPQLAQAKEIAAKFGNVKGVLAIYLTGSLAMSNSNTNSDIDLMIITENHRLWTTRILLTIYAELRGLRRRPHSPHSSGKVCLNLYLTPESFTLPTSKRSLYTAYELIQAIPLYDPHNTHPDLLLANSWIHSFLPNYPLPKGGFLVPKGSDSKGINILEYLAYNLQLLYMRPKLTCEYITPDSAFFHPLNPGIEVLKKLSPKKVK